MGDIVLHTDRGQHTTAVPNIFIDRYMQDANGEFVKIYLYLLRLLQQSGNPFSISALADRFHYTENDVHRALAYWENLHLLKLEYDGSSNLTGICFLEPNNNDREVPKVSPMTVREVPAYSMQDILSFKSQDGIKETLYAAETYLKRTLTSTDLNTILFWYEELHFSFDLIDYLIEYCVDKGHSSIYYMNKVAMNWADNHIQSVEDAKQSASIHSQAYYTVMKAFGISGRNLVDKEIAFIEKWTNSFGFSLDIITEACSRTIRNTGRANFSYADTILKSWHDKGIQHTEDIEALDQAHNASLANKNTTKIGVRPSNNRFHNFHQRPQDDDYYEALEQQLLRK